MFFPAMERTKDRRGTPSRNTSPAAVFLGGFPPVPRYEGGPLGSLTLPRRAKSRSVSLLLSGHWAFLPSKFAALCTLTYTRLLLPFLLGAVGVGRTNCHSSARVGGVRTTQTLNRGPRQSPAKRVWWGEEEQGSDMTDAHEWASGIKRTLRRRGPCGPRVKGRTVKT